MSSLPLVAIDSNIQCACFFFYMHCFFLTVCDGPDYAAHIVLPFAHTKSTPLGDK